MAPFLYPRREQKRLPHSQAFETSIRHSHSPKTHKNSPTRQETEEPYTHPGAQRVSTYNQTMRRWTLYQLQTSMPTINALIRYSSNYTASSEMNTPTIVSPLYPTTSSLFECSIGSSEQIDGEVESDIGETPCNTPKSRGLKRRSTVVVSKRKVTEEVGDQGESQARLRPVELVRSLSCAG